MFQIAPSLVAVPGNVVSSIWTRNCQPIDEEQLVEKGKVMKPAKWLLQTEKSYDAVAPDLKDLPSKAYFVMDTQDIRGRRLSVRLRRSEAQPREQGAAA